ncbi:hypothetical protein KBB96_11955 [Luteolibacter ambystomatis]|uniref:Secreted protein n=1 Tax=Luteolibacter ambystomatis TaxID=2824561 RepID=A0A975G5A9_9BACT|nr:hypothetical protein [Luteolibacter ambystomatis]QUE49587.1 hypothetical protein KBB96_11955 [Luteolibacter ambystomatis]
MKAFLHICLAGFTLSASAPAAEPTPEEWKKLWEQDKQAVKTGVCQVHHTSMPATTVPIHYGLVRPDPKGPTEAERIRLFPHARKFQLGGCCPIPDETTATIPVCDSCVKAEAAWLAARKVSRPASPKK